MKESQATRTVRLPPLSMRADIGPRSINDAERTVEVIITTTSGVKRFDWETGKSYVEVLSMDPAHIRLDRINGGAPLLDSHSAYSVADILGTVVPGSVSTTKKAMLGSVRFSKREAVQPIWDDVKDGIIRDVSVGYRVYAYEEKPGKVPEAPPVRTATDWEPFEVSMVPIPADAGAKVRGAESSDANPCEIVTASAPAVEQMRSAAPAAKLEEKSMKADEPSETIVEQNPLLAAVPPPKQTTEPSERDAGAEAERERALTIMEACTGNRLPISFARRLIAEKVPLVKAQTLILEELAKRDGDAPRPGPKIEVTGEDPLVHARAGIVNSLLHRVAPDRHKLEDIGRAYRGMSLLDIGRALLSARGVRVTMLSRSDLADAMMRRGGGMHTTTDFPYLLEDAARKNLRSAYEAAPQTWLPLASPVTLSDFKESRQLQVGDAPGLDEVLEHGEFSSGTITEAREKVQLKTYGKKFSITRQALINDDLSAFGQVPMAFGRKARDLESDLAWAQITSNPTMGDGAVLFIAAHGNLSPFGQDLTVGHMGDGRTAMRRQKGIDGVTPLNLTPRYLIVPAELETTADTLVTAITPAQASQANPFGPNGRTPLTVIVEPRLDDNSRKAWYMACPASEAPVLYYATLDGQTGPDLRQQEGFDVDGIQFRCRHDVAFKAADWRAIYKDSGA